MPAPEQIVTEPPAAVPTVAPEHPPVAQVGVPVPQTTTVPVPQHLPPPQPPQPQPQPQYQQPVYAPPQQDPMMMQIMQGMLETMQHLKNGHAQPQPDNQNWGDAINEERREIERLRRELELERRHEKRKAPEQVLTEQDLLDDDEFQEPGMAVPHDCELPFLTDPPSKPTVQVIFDLGIGGQHYKRFHHVANTGMWLSLIYDSRFEGDQFIPAPTPEGQSITLTFPQQNNQKVRAIVPDGCNQRIGCMDILNFVVTPEPQQAGQQYGG